MTDRATRTATRTTGAAVAAQLRERRTGSMMLSCPKCPWTDYETLKLYAHGCPGEPPPPRRKRKATA